MPSIFSATRRSASCLVAGPGAARIQVGGAGRGPAGGDVLRSASPGPPGRDRDRVVQSASPGRMMIASSRPASDRERLSAFLAPGPSRRNQVRKRGWPFRRGSAGVCSSPSRCCPVRIVGPRMGLAGRVEDEGYRHALPVVRRRWLGLLDRGWDSELVSVACRAAPRWGQRAGTPRRCAAFSCCRCRRQHYLRSP